MTALFKLCFQIIYQTTQNIFSFLVQSVAHMADAIVSSVVQQLTSLIDQEIREEVRLVVHVERELRKLKVNFEDIEAVLVDAEQRQLEEVQVRRWLEKLKDASYDMEDVLDEWNTARMKLKYEREEITNALAPKKMVCCSFFLSPCFGFKQVLLRHDIAQKIKKISENLDDISKAKDRFNFTYVTRSTENSVRVPSTSLINVSEICGRDEEKNTLKSKLLCDSSEDNCGVQIISMVGMGGIGKTTLAQLVYNDNEVKRSFENRMWVCVSDSFGVFKIAKAIIEALEGSTASNVGETLQSLLVHINESLARKKFLLVLDDVWTEDYNKWEPFRCCLKNGLCGSKILVTTRKDTVAQMMESIDIITIKELSYQECWLLFQRFAFFGRPPSECEKLKGIGKEIVNKCKGLPLAVKIIGSLLSSKRSKEEWQSILNSKMWEFDHIEKGVFAPLLLSYNDLPSKIKPCFSYCAVFSKDNIIKKDALIKLWMAQGYLKGGEMEIIGEEYFKYLASRSFFQEFSKDIYGRVETCKMHDMVHDVAQFLSKNECFSIEIGGLEESLINSICLDKVRHSRLMLGESASIPVSIFSARKLRSLLISGQFHICPPAFGNVFDELTRLRALGIYGNCFPSKVNVVDKIPKGIENLIHLRYLKLFALKLEELPEGCCELYNLQTLEIKACFELRRLPQGIGKLGSLRHLTYDVGILDSMPKEIGRLTGLRTLSNFFASDGGQSNLECLKHLNLLRGSLAIRGLGNVLDVDESKKAELEKKKNLSDLELRFDKRDEEPTERMNEGIEAIVEVDHEAIIEALRPNPNIERLVIDDYKGKISLPNWLKSLTNLKFLDLKYCVHCENMPPLGKLPSLEKIHIEGMRRVKRVGAEFLGIESDGTTSSSSSSPVITFPKLKSLQFQSMDEWEEWDFEIPSSGKEDIRIVPNLESLRIADCPKLKELPDQIQTLDNLQTLDIKQCPKLRSLPQVIGRLTGLRTLSNFFVSDGGQCNLECLKHLNLLRGSLAIRGLDNVLNVDEAKNAELEKKKNLSALVLWFDKQEEETSERMNEGIEAIVKMDHEAIIEALRPNPDIESLQIGGYKGKIILPSWLMSLTKLKTLELESCINCENMPPLGKLPSLETISIERMRRVKRVGAEFLGIKSDGTTSSSSSSPVIIFPKLENLCFDLMDEWEEWDFEIPSSGKEDIRIMPNLKYLVIVDCPKLRTLPDKILQSTLLVKLSIIDCPILSERFKKETGEDWHKISHIPKIEID